MNINFTRQIRRCESSSPRKETQQNDPFGHVPAVCPNTKPSPNGSCLWPGFMAPLPARVEYFPFPWHHSHPVGWYTQHSNGDQGPMDPTCLMSPFCRWCQRDVIVHHPLLKVWRLWPKSPWHAVLIGFCLANTTNGNQVLRDITTNASQTLSSTSNL